MTTPGSTEKLESGSWVRWDEKAGRLRATRYDVQVVQGPDRGRTTRLEGTLLVGSHADAGFQLTDGSVSRFHLELQLLPGGVRVKDLGSTNGTFLGEARITDVTVREGLVTIGKSQLSIQAIEDDLGAPRQDCTHFGGAVGTTEVMRRLFGMLERVSISDATVLLEGETGTGKDVLARAIHEHSERSDRPFVVVDCGAMAATLVESELFGHVRGAFTGAAEDRAGAFEQAHGGTLYLDRVADMPLELQPKLLRVLESGTLQRLGDAGSRTVDVRVLAAAHCGLESRVRAGAFREDLYFRLAVLNARVPPLRERPEDVPLLARHFLREAGRVEFDFSPGLLEALRHHSWPGNVRELRNVVERALAGDPDPLSPGGAVRAASSLGRAEFLEVPFKIAKEQLVEAFTCEYLTALLERVDGNMSEASRLARINRGHLYELLAKYGLRGQD